MTNNVLSLWSLSSASLYVPLQVPDVLEKRKQSDTFHNVSSHSDWSDMSITGALFSSFIDTSTLTTRLHDSSKRQSISSFASTLNWRRDTPIASIGGCIPIPLLAPVGQAPRQIDPIEALLLSRGLDTRRNERNTATLETPEQRAKRGADSISKHFMDLSHRCDSFSPMPFARISTAREWDTVAKNLTREAVESVADEDNVGWSDVVPLPFNIKSASFPQMFQDLSADGRVLPGTPSSSQENASRPRVERIPMYSSLTSTPKTAHMLEKARSWLDRAVIRGHDPLSTFGLGASRGRSGAGQAASDDTEGLLGGRDGLLEVRERLDELLGAYDDGGHQKDEDNVGTDEECDSQNSDWDV